MYPPLFERFDEIAELPIEISEIAKAICDLGFQDQVIVRSSPHLDAGTLRGLMFKEIAHSTPYGEPIHRAFVLYPENVDLGTQRVICAKELIHICDRPDFQVNTSKNLLALVEDVIRPGTRNGVPTESSIIALADQFAEYQALDLLLPRAAREIARGAVASGRCTYAEVAEWAVIPEKYVPSLLGPHWEKLSVMLRSIPPGVP